MEWMQRVDGIERYYSDARYNGGEGSGDLSEIRKRRKWRQLDFWQSDVALSFGPPVLVDGVYRRNEYLYIGRTSPGQLKVYRISVQGRDASFFSLSRTSADISQGNYAKIKVSFESLLPDISIKSLDAYIEIRNSVSGVRNVPILGEE